MEEAQESSPRVQRFRGFDRTFVAILAGVFLFNFGLASAVASRAKTWVDDWALMDGADTSERIATLSPRPLPKPERKQPAKDGEGTPKVASAGPAKGHGGPKRPAELGRDLVRKSGVLALLGTRGLGDGGNLVDQLWAGREAGSLEKALQGANGLGVGVRLDDGAERRGPGAGEAKTIGDIGTGGGADNESRQLTDRGLARLRPRVTFEEEEDPEPTPPGCDRAAIAKVVKRGLSALQHCYEVETKKLPTLAGRVLVRVTVGAGGRVTEVELDEDTVGSPGLRRCLELTFRRWAFPAAPEECVISHPIVFAPVP